MSHYGYETDYVRDSLGGQQHICFFAQVHVQFLACEQHLLQIKVNVLLFLWYRLAIKCSYSSYSYAVRSNVHDL